MRILRVAVSVALLLTAASAAELKIKVVDPQSAVVAGAQVSLSAQGRATPWDVQTTTAEGQVWFHGVSPGRYQVEILAPGFAPQHEDLPADTSEITVQLRLPAAVETVVVSATRTPAPAEDAGASVSTLESGQLAVMQPVSAADAMRFLPGAVVDTSGRRGGISSLFVRGGDSRYNKVIIDDVPVSESGGTTDFGVFPLAEADRLEFVRGAQSTLYGSDALTSVVQVFTRTGSTAVPELRFGADGGTFETAHGYASVAGARGRFDYNLFADQFNTNGQGVSDDYSNSLQGGNAGVQLGPKIAFRLRARHSNSRTGVQGEWNFNGQPLLPPDTGQWARQNNLLVSGDLAVTGPSRWQHHFSGFEYNHKRTNEDDIADPNRLFDVTYHNIANFNRAGFDYQGDYVERSWAHTTFGYEFEDENGFFGDFSAPTHGLRLNHAVYVQQMLTLGRLSAVAGARFVHNGTFGNKGVPRVALTLQALKGGPFFSGTRLRFSYATGIKEPRFEEAFAGPPFSVPNPNLKAEESRAFEAGVVQTLAGGKYAFTATYFNNLFRNQIDYKCCNSDFQGQYVNVNQSIAHGAEVEIQGRPLRKVSLDAAYNYNSTQILQAPFCTPANFCDPRLARGQPLLRRPKHSGSLLLTYLGSRWGANLGGSFVGRRTDSDFFGFGIDHAAGYARVDVGGWYAISSRMTAYVNVENALNKPYEEVTGYPALKANFRAGMRFRIGGE